VVHATSTGAEATEVRTVIPAFRYLLVPFVALAFGATWSLFLVPERTEDFFAWPIEPPLTAALLGAAYAGALVFFVLALREPVWAYMRIVVSAPLVLSTLMLIATLVHVDKFALDAAELVPKAVAWIWLVVYLLVPPGLVVLWVLQSRAPGVDPPRDAPMPVPLKVLMAVYGGVSVVGGLILFVVPAEVVPHWPWAITPLTGRALAAWITALGAASLQGLQEADLRRVRIGLVAFTVIGALGLVAVLRFADTIDWDVGGWLLVLYLVAMLAGGAVGWLLAPSAHRAAQPSVAGG